LGKLLAIGVPLKHERSPPTTGDQPPSSNDDRREFLKKCGKFAAVTPPAVTLLLSTSLTSPCRHLAAAAADCKRQEIAALAPGLGPGREIDNRDLVEAH
jgi:hypothetical protein